jgi:pyruvate formate-lyase activating enzyme-like uncharacterized protein
LRLFFRPIFHQLSLRNKPLRALINYQNALVDGNRKEYGNSYDQINFVSYYEGLEMEQQRSAILENLEGKIQWAFNNTKTDATRMSPGCRLCGEGQWSCLFINGKCNCNCFYCPAPQTDIGQPVTQTLTFDDPMSYVDYIRRFNFKGVSFSGGEPFLTFDRVKLFLETLRRELPSDLYIWMYTNGTRVTLEHLHELARLGLNEIRYDIGAIDYNLKPVKQAIGIIPVVTVEIPAVPDEIDKLKECIRELADAGLSFMNLHQLRLTPHNMSNLLAKNYLFAHGQRVTVPASEMCALELIQFTKDEGINLPINYCSFVYKNRFQKSGLRKKLAANILQSHQAVTENGYIRQISVALNNKTLSVFTQLSDEVKLRTMKDDALSKIFVQLSDVSVYESFVDSFEVQYVDVRLIDGQAEGENIKTISLASNHSISIEWAQAAQAISLPITDLNLLRDLAAGISPDQVFDDAELFKIRQFELIESGLSEIY